MPAPKRPAADMSDLDRLLTHTPEARLALRVMTARLRAGTVRRDEARQSAPEAVERVALPVRDTRDAVPKPAVPKRPAADMSDLDRLLTDTPEARLALRVTTARLRAGTVRRDEARQAAPEAVGPVALPVRDAFDAVPKAAASKRPAADMADLDRLLADTGEARLALRVSDRPEDVVTLKEFGAQLRVGALLRADGRDVTIVPVGQGADRGPDIPTAVPRVAAQRRRSPDLAALDRLLSDTPEARIALTVFGAQLRAGALLRADARDATVAPAGQAADRAPDVSTAPPEAAQLPRRAGDEAEPFEAGDMPPMPVAQLHDDDVRTTEIVRLLPVSTEQDKPPRPERINAEPVTSVGPCLPPGDADHPFEADLPISSSEPQLSVAPAGHPASRAENGGDENDRLIALLQTGASALAPVATTEAEVQDPRSRPIGPSFRDLAIALIERRKAAGSPAALGPIISVEAVIPNVSTESATAASPPPVAVENRAIDNTPGAPVGAGASPPPTTVETAVTAPAINPRVVAADPPDAASPSTTRAIDGAEGHAQKSSRNVAAPVPPPRTPAPPIPSARGVEGPGSPARVYEAPPPPSVSGSDRTLTRPSASLGVPSSSAAFNLSSRLAVVLQPDASKALPPSTNRAPTSAATQPAPDDTAVRIFAVVLPVAPMRPSGPTGTDPSSPTPPTSAAIPPGPQAETSPEAPYWDPRYLPSGKRRLAGRFAAYLDQHRDWMSHAARIASLREALGPDAVPLERWIMFVSGAASRGHVNARTLLDQLISLGTTLTGNTDKETIGKENEEICQHGGKPMPVQPPWDPHRGDHAGRFLSASFLTARSIGSVELEKAVIFANAKRYKETSTWSAHLMERVWVWANEDVPKASAFHASQPRQDRLSKHPETTWGRWLEILQHEYRSATGKDLFDGSGMGM